MLPKVAAKFITENAENVSINIENVTKLSNNLVEEFNNNVYSLKKWKSHILHPKIMDLKAISWIFFADTINFSFWADLGETNFKVDYKNVTYTGYWSICAAINRCVDNEIIIFDSLYMKNLTVEQFNQNFRSVDGVTVPLVEDRVKALKEAGSVLIERFGGHFVNCIIKADKSAQKLLNLIVENFSSYKDEAMYNDQRVCLYKRAQILIADIWCCFEGQGYGEFHDIDTLTAFADYRVPQVLAYFGAIEYSQQLKDDLEKKIIFPNGDRREVEIRGVTLQCIEMMVELIRGKVTEKACIVNSILVDNYLWDYRRSNAGTIESVPMHRTRTIYY